MDKYVRHVPSEPVPDPEVWVHRSKVEKLKEDLVHSPNRRRKLLVWGCVYILVACALIAYIVTQASRINAEVAVRTGYMEMTNISFPGLVLCRAVEMQDESWYPSTCHINRGANRGTSNCISHIQQPEAVFPSLQSEPLKKYLHLPENTITFTNYATSVSIGVLVLPKRRKLAASVVYVGLYSGNNGTLPKNLHINGVSVTNAQTLTTLALTLTKHIGNDTYSKDYTSSTITLPYRHNYTLETADPSVGGLPYEFGVQTFVFPSFTVKTLDYHYTYTLMDFAGQLGGILGMAGSIIAVILGPGPYDPSGLVHKARVVKEEEEEEREYHLMGSVK